MTEAALFLEKAGRSFTVAELLRDNGDLDFAASRAYYGCFYIAHALLLTRGLSFSRHGQVIGQYGYHFARTGVLDPAFHSLLDEAFNIRQSADYAAISPAKPEQVTRVIEGGRRFLAAATEYLQRTSPPTE